MTDTDYHIIPGPPEHHDPREVFVLQLAQALHKFGTPAHRLEQTMAMVMKQLGMQGEFFALPTSLFASFGRPEAHRTSMMRGETGDVNLEKLSLLDKLAERIILRQVSLEEGKNELREIIEQPKRYQNILSIVGSGLGTAISALVFNGGWREILVAGIIGILLGAIAPFFAREEARRRVFEIVAALLAASVAVAAAHFFTPFSVFIATLAGLIMLLPGMRLTTAMTEIASGHLVSGAARLTGAVMAFLGIAFGTALGNRMASLLFET
ncbi:MAG: threonine/serine exporter family protein, partial [Candidatus Kapaibacterium sp.]